MVKIREILETDWQEIFQIQKESYHSIEPESVEVLKSKWEMSPETCFVLVEENKILAYLLSHPWFEDDAPDLYTKLEFCPNTNGIFIHDLAVLPISQGKGLGRIALKYLFQYAKAINVYFISLVSIQGSGQFWEKFNFEPKYIAKPLDSYGQESIYRKLIIN
ncbi:MAG: GNAT family N-acetyltransferase [Leptospiraceae bacterium]|nr:GNAT family N-acetyltransferase [Leptospiraceae bacterium]